MAFRHLTPWRPPAGGEHPLTVFQREVNDLFDAFWRGGGLEPLRQSAAAFTPRIDVHDGPEAITVEAEVPGLEPKDVEITVRGDALVLKGEKRGESEESSEGWVHRERTFGSFERVIPLPPGVDAGAIQARCKSGVLTVTVPKPDGTKAAARRIDIESA